MSSPHNVFLFSWLNGNKLRRISRETFSKSKNLKKLDLRVNPITEIEFGSFSGAGMLEELRIDSVQFLCDCNLFWFAQFVQNRTNPIHRENSILCHHPEALKGVSISDLDVQTLKCDSNPRPVMIKNPITKSIQVGSEVKFECTAKTSELESVEIEWQYQKDQTSGTSIKILEPNELVSIDHVIPTNSQGGNQVISTLIMRDLDKNAMGYYKCFIRNHYGHVNSNLAHLIVHQTPYFTTEPRDRIVILDEKVNFYFFLFKNSKFLLDRLFKN